MFVVLSCLGSVIFFSVGLLCGSDLVYFWLFLELAGLCLIPCIYLEREIRSWKERKVGEVALVYLIVLRVSSSALLLGVVRGELAFFMLLGFIIKFGIFPFKR